MNTREPNPSSHSAQTAPSGNARRSPVRLDTLRPLFLLCISSTLSAEPVEPLVDSASSDQPATSADEEPWKPTFGLGVGSLYSTAGLNIGLKTTDSLGVLSFGCRSRSDTFGCQETVQLGYYRTDLLGSDSGRHAIGLWAGRTSATAYSRIDEIFGRGIDPESRDRGATWNGGVGYLYFHKGIGNRGPVIGLGYQIEERDGRSSDGRFEFSLGFQF